MTLTEFYSRLGNLPRSYKWNTENGKIVSQHKDAKLNPITAVIHRSGVSCGNTKSETIKAAQLLGLAKRDAENVYDAASGRSNRGYQQVVRGRLKNILGL